MSDMQIFKGKFGRIRVIMRDCDPWFVAKDVCDCLAIANYRDAITSLDDDEKGVAITDTLGGKQEMAIISESGLYSLVLRSRKPEAKAFKRWVTHDVLPSIRKTGAYNVAPKTYLEALKALVVEVEAKEKAQAALESEKAAHAETTDKLNEVSNVANNLMINQGLADKFRKIRAIPWLKKYFKIDGVKSPFYGNCGKFMTRLCLQQRYEIKDVSDEDWGTVNAYEMAAWDFFNVLLNSGVITKETPFIGKYLL